MDNHHSAGPGSGRSGESAASLCGPHDVVSLLLFPRHIRRREIAQLVLAEGGGRRGGEEQTRSERRCQPHLTLRQMLSTGPTPIASRTDEVDISVGLVPGLTKL